LYIFFFSSFPFTVLFKIPGPISGQSEISTILPWLFPSTRKWILFGRHVRNKVHTTQKRHFSIISFCRALREAFPAQILEERKGEERKGEERKGEERKGEEKRERKERERKERERKEREKKGRNGGK
jgi:hypothetical protein